LAGIGVQQNCRVVQGGDAKGAAAIVIWAESKPLILFSRCPRSNGQNNNATQYEFRGIMKLLEELEGRTRRAFYHSFLHRLAGARSIFGPVQSNRSALGDMPLKSTFAQQTGIARLFEIEVYVRVVAGLYLGRQPRGCRVGILGGDGNIAGRVSILERLRLDAYQVRTDWRPVS